MLVLSVSSNARAGDPYLRWYTVKTPHFRIHYHAGLEGLAQRTANLAESVHGRLVPALSWKPREITHIVITDDTDSANGSASTLPYNQVHMYASAPDDMSVLGDYDDWLGELVTHEYTHVLHVDNISGIPAILNAIFGKSAAPNQAQPRWILEGLAVLMESEHTTAGRLRSSQFDMFLRADVLEDNIATLDQISNPTRRWPGGNLWYLYGSKFIEWITSVYGPHTYAAVATDYGNNPIPGGVNRSIRRVTGRTYEELYVGWIDYLQRRYTEQTDAIRARGLREGKRLTYGGRAALTPRFVPNCDGNKQEQLIYYRDDGDSTAGLYRLPLDAKGDSEAQRELIARTNVQNVSFDAECGMIFANVAPARRPYIFTDLFRQPPGTTSKRGTERNRQRLTIGERAREPDVSPDGRKIAYVTNRAGTSTLRIADFTPDHRIENVKRLVPSARFEQAFTPRFSPDGLRIAYSAWTHGGYRDIRIVDVATGKFSEISHDRALDQQPVWSPDGKRLFFTSDRTGVANIYVYDIGARTLRQVTNVLTGAYMPALSNDGKTLAYIGYTSAGFDVFVMPLDEARFLEAPPLQRERAKHEDLRSQAHFPVERYSPWPTLRPRYYELDYRPSPFGQALTVTTNGSDAVGLHGIVASLAIETSEADPQLTLDYAYSGLPFIFRTSGFRSASPRRGYRYGYNEPLIVEHLTGVTTGISLYLPGEFDGQSLALNYTAAEFSQNLPVGTRGDPYASVPVDPHNGFLGIARIGYSYTNAEASANAVSTEKGFSIGAGLDYADPIIGSDSTLTAFSASITGYVPMPWSQHHVFALALSGATAIGNYPRRGLYSVGGYADLPLIDAYTSGVRQGAFVLRGYAPSQFIGTQYNLLNAEYRFPILYADRGISTLPVFLRTLSGAVFADYGGAFNVIDPDDVLDNYHLGVGAELWLDLVVGYFIGGSMRIGIAKGIDSEAPSGFQTYTVVSSGF
jgi:hypothetical protein